MSTPPPQALPAHKPAEDEVEIKIISHSNLFYWWPVWAIGAVMGLLTWADRHYMVVVPHDARAAHEAHVKVEKTGTSFEGRDTIVLPKDAKLQTPDPDDPERPSKVHMAVHGTYGVIFVII